MQYERFLLIPATLTKFISVVLQLIQWRLGTYGEIVYCIAYIVIIVCAVCVSSHVRVECNIVLFSIICAAIHAKLNQSFRAASRLDYYLAKLDNSQGAPEPQGP